MAATYTAKQKQAAAAGGQFLVTIDAAGLSFQGPVTREERDRLNDYLIAFLSRRPRKWEATTRGHTVTGTYADGKWAFACDTLPDLAERHTGAATVDGIMRELEALDADAGRAA